MRILFFCFTIAFGFAHAQESREIDSMKRGLLFAANDTNKVKTYFGIGNFYKWTDPDSALLYAMPGLGLAKKLDFKAGEYDLIWAVSEALSLKGNYSRALELRFRSLELARELKDLSKIANSLALIGTIYYDSKDYSNALKYLYEAKATKAEGLGGPKVINGFIGETYFYLNNMDSALVYVQKAYDLDQMDTTFHWSVPYQFLAAIYEQKKDFSKAIKLYKQSFGISQNNIDKFKDYNGIASVYKKTGQLDSAIFYAKKVISEATKVSIVTPIVQANALLASIYKSMHETDSALKYEEGLLAAKDSLFSQDKLRQMQNVTFDEELRQQEIAKEKELYKNQVKQYSLIAALTILITIGIILWRNNKHKQKANVLLKQQKEKVESTLTELKSTQAQLIQSEKMASLGELTAGIAHEIQNPLNFVNNFSDVNKELVDELQNELKAGNTEEAIIISDDIKANEEKINHHGRRADSIVKGMLQHSRSSSGVKEPTNINTLADEYLRLSYHGLRAKDKSFNVTLNTDYDETIGNINIIPQDVGRVLLNLYNNAFYAVNEKSKIAGAGYEPIIEVSTSRSLPPGEGKGEVRITVKDNGNGIPQKIVDKIFHPFFTTKPTGEGTGLGLSLSYDIIKAHGGDIKVETKEGEGTEFIIQLPVLPKDNTNS